MEHELMEHIKEANTMTAELLAATLEDLFVHTIPKMDAEQPKKMQGEASRIYDFSFESFRIGFLHGLKAGIGTLEKEKKT